MKKIIIIDDNQQWCNRLSGILRDENFIVESESVYSKSFLDRLRKVNDYQLLIVDIQLDELNLARDEGIELIAEVRGFNKDVPIIIVSGFGEPEKVRNAFVEYNISDFIFKQGFKRVAFIDVVKRVIDIKLKSSDLSPKELNIINNKGSFTIIYGNGEIGNISYSVDNSKRITTYANVEHIIPGNFKKILEEYTSELKTEINLILQKLTDHQAQDYNEIMDCFKELYSHNDIVKDFLSALHDKDSKITTNQLEVAISLIPGILNIKKTVDLDGLLKNLTDVYDKSTFPVYEKLANIYFALKGKINK